jgi:hypothetical protein
LLRWAAAGRSSAWCTSGILHAAVLFLLSLWLFASPGDGPRLWLRGGVEPGPPEDLQIDFTLGGHDSGSDAAPADMAAAVTGHRASVAGAASAVRSPQLPQYAEAETNPAVRGIERLGSPLAARGGGMAGRRGTNRQRLALSGGGTLASESAVEKGLAWLAAHQLQDGSWRFDLQDECPACAGSCRNSGSYRSTTASTGLAILSFLGAGYTHREGPYQDTVGQGLYYLQAQQTISSQGGDLRDQRVGHDADGPAGIGRGLPILGSRFDTMYSHGIATLALTEAYAMTRDVALREASQQAIDFIVHAQFADGGWRYVPFPESPGPGDMTVTGWQIMALKSGLLGGLEVPYEVWDRISGFLDHLQDQGGAAYRYLYDRAPTPTPTAIGLLSRMIGGWPRDARPLTVGVAKLNARKPSQNDMYFNYYASQVLHHAGGAPWKKWNPSMRDYLVDTQASDGHETGSWYFAEAHSTPGGRLYTTTMAIMTLEVYYRYLPLYDAPFIDNLP